VCDDVNLPIDGCGRAGPVPDGGHNGLASVAERLARLIIRGSASVLDAGMRGATWPITCWPDSTPTKFPGLKRRLPGR
jgi:hypothetical protein